MKVQFSIIIAFVIFTSCFVSAEDKVQNKANIKQKSIRNSEFFGFEECRISNELSATLTKIIAEEVPIKKEETAWTYSITSEVMSLPVKAIQIGVCGADGAQDCGWGSYLALTIAKPFNEARRQLKKLKGIDYSKEKRDKEYEVTLRPVLAISKADGETVLYCDPGTL
jgi:hypothetical protein